MALYTVCHADLAVCRDDNSHSSHGTIDGGFDVLVQCENALATGATLVGYRGQREQTMGGAPPGSNIEPSSRGRACWSFQDSSPRGHFCAVVIAATDSALHNE